VIFDWYKLSAEITLLLIFIGFVRFLSHVLMSYNKKEIY